MERKEERKWIVKLIYQHNFNEITESNLDSFLEEFELNNSEFIKNSILSIIKNIKIIDDLIYDNISVSKKNTLLAIEKAILRVSINEFVVQKHVPTSVSINEAINISKDFSNEESYKFINGILSAIAKKTK